MATKRHKEAICAFMCFLCFFEAKTSAQVWRNVWVSEYEPNSAEKSLLAPSPEVQQQFAGFLQLPDTGLIRMYPPGRRRVISVTDLATGRRPGFGIYASIYSFSKSKHGNGLHGYVDPRLGWAELRLLSFSAWRRSSDAGDRPERNGSDRSVTTGLRRLEGQLEEVADHLSRLTRDAEELSRELGR